MESSPKLKGLDLTNTRFDVDLSKPSPNHKTSVKGMKIFARLRASHSLMVSAVGEASSASHEHELHDASASCSNYGGHQKESISHFQFTTGQQAVAGQDLRGRGSRDPGDGNPESTSNHTTMVGQVQGSGN